MSKIDPRLLLLQQEAQEAETSMSIDDMDADGVFDPSAFERPSPKARVLLQFEGDLAEIEARGLETFTVAGDIAAGMVELDKLDDVAASPNLIKIESSRPMAPELDASVPEARVNKVWASPHRLDGTGVIVGIIDSGIDFTHQNFRKADGTSRILFLWDQNLRPNSSENALPTSDGRGVEYEKADIDRALASSNPASIVRSTDGSSGHGTHVTGIAAGNGRAVGGTSTSSTNNPFTYIGVAPNADIILVDYRGSTEALGDSANTLAAAAYIFNTAKSLKKPVVINISQGDNLGPHDGTSLLERGLDNLLGEPGQIMVKSAGNAANDNIHARGKIVPPSGSNIGSDTIPFTVPSTTQQSPLRKAIIDIWYSGDDSLGVTITPPQSAGSQSLTFNAGSSGTLTASNRNSVSVVASTDPVNKDNRIYIQITRGTRFAIQNGNWSLTLTGSVKNGRYDAWIERGTNIPSFTSARNDTSRTISIPGTSEELIVVASYQTANGQISNFSSLGPTRDGRRKPDIAAPGQSIISALAGGSGRQQYQGMSGTSMATPHVTGVIALLLQKNKYLTQDQIKNFLARSAREDEETGKVPNNTWGHGKLDAEKAAECGLWMQPVLHMMSS